MRLPASVLFKVDSSFITHFSGTLKYNEFLLKVALNVFVVHMHHCHLGTCIYFGRF